MRYEILDGGNNVINTINAEQSFVDTHYAGHYRLVADLAQPQAQARKMTKLAFLSRFTDTEAIAIDLASIGATVVAATLRRATNKTNAATYIDPQLPETRNGVIAMEATTLIGVGRALIILDAPITDTELYKG